MEMRVPPQNIAAEQSVLGGLMLEQDAFDNVSDLLSEDDFYKPAHRIIFRCIRELNKTGQPADLVCVSNYLMKTGQIDQIGGPGYLAELLEQTFSTVNIKSYAHIVREKSILRKVINLSQGFVEKAYANDFQDLDGFINDVEAGVFKVSEMSTNNDLVDSSTLVRLSLDRLEKLYAQKGDVTGVATGFIELDKMTAGLQPSELIVIAARPSMGKTAFSLNIALHAALREKKTVAYFSVEMASEAVMMRMLASEARVSMSGLRSGNIDDYVWPKLISTAAKLSEAPIYIDDTPAISPFEIRAKARRMKARHGLDMIIVDYLQLMSLKQKVESRTVEVSEISKMLKGIARELKVPVIALAQLNRGVESRTDRRPMLSDLRESGAIEQDADVIMMLYRDEYYDRDNQDLRGLAEVIIGKQRNGPTGTVKLRWVPEFGLFQNHIENAAGPTPPMPSSPNPGGGPTNKVTPIAPPPHPGGKPRNFAPSI